MNLNELIVTKMRPATVWILKTNDRPIDNNRP